METTIYQHGNIHIDIYDAVESIDHAIETKATNIKIKYELTHDEYYQVVHEIKRIMTNNFNN